MSFFYTYFRDYILNLWLFLPIILSSKFEHAPNQIILFSNYFTICNIIKKTKNQVQTWIFLFQSWNSIIDFSTIDIIPQQRLDIGSRHWTQKWKERQNTGPTISMWSIDGPWHWHFPRISLCLGAPYLRQTLSQPALLMKL